MRTGIDYDKVAIKIDIDYLLESMSEDDCKAFIKHFSIQECVINHVIDYICGDDPDGWWTGNDADLRMKLLQRVEKKQLDRPTRWGWSVWREVEARLKEIRCKQQIYWKLYHNDSPFEVTLYDGTKKTFERMVIDWLSNQGIQSNYTTLEADNDIRRVEGIIVDALKAMKE